MTDVFKNILSSEEFREEFFVAGVQAQLSRMLDDKGVSRAELARRLDVSRARVSQIFSDEAQNFTLKLLARSFLAVGEEPVVVPRSEYEALKRQTGGNAERSGVATKEAADGIAEALIANLLRANLTESPSENERKGKRSGGIKDWASGSNVIPFRVTANG
jgi:transcriptional regulator with XRE-family HTH domain